jgi:hypothetical protein
LGCVLHRNDAPQPERNLGAVLVSDVGCLLAQKLYDLLGSRKIVPEFFRNRGTILYVATPMGFEDSLNAYSTIILSLDLQMRMPIDGFSPSKRTVSSRTAK